MQVTATEAAKMSGLSEKTIRLWIKSGKLPATKRGRDWEIEMDILAEVTGNNHNSLEDIIEQLVERVNDLEFRMRLLESSKSSR